jgi:hypothetical protein
MNSLKVTRKILGYPPETTLTNPNTILQSQINRTTHSRVEHARQVKRDLGCIIINIYLLEDKIQERSIHSHHRINSFST